VATSAMEAGSSTVCAQTRLHDPMVRRVSPGPPPRLDWERLFWRSGLQIVAGVDEVGRGAMAGPLVAAAVVLPSCEGHALRRLRATLSGVRDSK
jgi:hypothetical protein